MTKRPLKTDKDISLYKLPPQNLEAEESLLSALILDNTTLLEVVEIVTQDDFYSNSHKLIFEAILELFRKSEPIDLITLTNILTTKGQIEQISGSSYQGISYLSWLTDAAPIAVNAPYYARIVRDKACLRRLIEKANDITRRCYEAQEDVDEVINFAESSIFEISENKINPSFYSISDIIESNIDTLEERQGNKTLITGVPTGFVQLDRLTSGFQSSDLIILAARPSMGKTAFALNLARNAAVDANVPVGIFSLEMAKDQLSMRMLSAEARVDSSRLRGGFFSQDDWEALTEAAGILSEAPIYIDDSADISAIEIRAKARRLKMEKDLGLVIIDYLQLMKGRASAERRDLEISEISRSLKALAKELNIPVIALSQLNRKLEERADKRPMLSDLRESGCLTGDTLITLATGENIKIKTLVEKKEPVKILTLNQSNYKIEPVHITNAFSTGIKPVYLLTTASGKTIKATINHKFKEFESWKRLDELKIGDYIAVPRQITSYKNKNGKLTQIIYYATSSCGLAQDVSTLLMRFGINASLRKVSQGKKGRDQYHIIVTGKPDVEKFIYNIGAVGSYKKQSLEKIKVFFSEIKANPNKDIIPKNAWKKYVVPSMTKNGITTREMQARINNSYCGTSLYKSAMSRERAEKVALAVNSSELLLLSKSSIYWDKIKNIEFYGNEEVFDLTVPIHHNFVANNIIVHNSIEQDADVVAFIYRDEVYNKDENNPSRGKAEIILGKQRNGPIGTAHLTFLNTYTRFENPAPEDMMNNE